MLEATSWTRISLLLDVIMDILAPILLVDVTWNKHNGRLLFGNGSNIAIWLIYTISWGASAAAAVVAPVTLALSCVVYHFVFVSSGLHL